MITADEIKLAKITGLLQFTKTRIESGSKSKTREELIEDFYTNTKKIIEGK